MRIIECQDVDLISPFPLHQVPRLRTWLFCYKSLILDDTVPTDKDEVEQFLTAGLQSPNTVSWGVIDKNNTTRYTHPAPLVGFISFEFISPYTGYFHVASPRPAWGLGLIDAAGRAAIAEIFNGTQALRVSAAVLNKNRPAKNLCYRLGFRKDGLFEDYVMQNGQPLSVVHFGLTRAQWLKSLEEDTQCLPLKTSLKSEQDSSPESDPLSVQDSEPPLTPSEVPEDKADSEEIKLARLL